MDNSVYHTVVIGAGQAGLAAAYYLRRRQLAYVVLDGHKRIGDSWRNRWEGLRLFSPQRYNGLPGLPPPGDDWYLPTRLEAADYLEGYAAHFDLNVRTGNYVTRVERTDGGFIVETGDTNPGMPLYCKHLIVANGAYQGGFVPKQVSSTFPRPQRQLHVRAVRRAEEYGGAGRRVLVAGAGASGQQLAWLLLATGAEVLLAGPAVANLPRAFLGKDIYWWLYKSGSMTLRTDRFPGRQLVGRGGDITVGEHPKALIDHPRLTRIENHLEAYREGALYWRCRETHPEPTPWPVTPETTLIWCTGYRNHYPWLLPESLPVEKALHLRTAGDFTGVPNLYFLGQPNLRRPNSSLMGGVGRDARELVLSLPNTTYANE